MQTEQVVIRRGAEVVGPDGVIGTVAHVVVDEATREISELVVRRADGCDLVVPVSAIAPAGEAGALELRREELHVQKDTRERGVFELRKEVVSERRGLDVPVWHEELIVERQSIEPPRPIEDTIAGEGQASVRVVLREEVPVAEKQPVVTESVRAARRSVEDTQRIDTTVRMEVADVRREGDVRLQDARQHSPPDD